MVDFMTRRLSNAFWKNTYITIILNVERLERCTLHTRSPFATECRSNEIHEFCCYRTADRGLSRGDFSASFQHKTQNHLSERPGWKSQAADRSG